MAAWIITRWKKAAAALSSNGGSGAACAGVDDARQSGAAAFHAHLGVRETCCAISAAIASAEGVCVRLLST